jgi:biopolymer transport protein ExbD
MPAATDRTLLSVRHFVSRLPPRASQFLFLVPLLNVLFFLLIFVVIGSSVLPLPGQLIELPTVQEPIYTTADKYVITMSRRTPAGARREGPSAIFFNNTEVSDFNQLENALPSGRPGETAGASGRTKSSGDYQPVIILRADRDVPLQELAAVMDLCRRKAFRLLIVTEQRQP